MPINFDKSLGIHDDAVFVRQQRTTLLASNIANADTPNYKAKDLDFREVLQQTGAKSLTMRTTHEKHQMGGTDGFEPYLQFRMPDQPSADGNTVDVQQEKAQFAENAVRYQASLTFLSRKFSGLSNAFKGE